MAYTVASGDSLSKIAAKYGITWQELYEANKGVIGSNPNLIYPGQTYVVPGDSGWGGGGGGATGGGGTSGGGGSAETDMGQAPGTFSDTISVAQVRSMLQAVGADVTQAERIANEINTGTRSLANLQFWLNKLGSQAGKGVGDPNPEGSGITGGGAPSLVSILSSPTLQWTFDPDTGKWYASYKLPNSDRRIFFEATAEQLDSLFGDGNRPAQYNIGNFESLAGSQTFSGDISEMAGSGSFEDEVKKTINLALDEGALPDWAKNDPAVLDLIYIAHMEGKSDEWLYTQLSKLDSFKQRFPGIEELTGLGLTLVEAVGAFLEFEQGLKQQFIRQGRSADYIDPSIVGALLGQGVSLSDVAFVFDSFERFNGNADALAAFNEVLVARGMAPLSAEDQLAFLEGNAPEELYRIWEEASFNQAAIDAGLDISVQDAMALAGATEGFTGYGQAFGALNQAAASILRFRADLDLNRYGLDQEDMIDLALGIAPRSGRTAAEITNAMDRALSSARAGIDGPRAHRFTGFTQEGVPQGASTQRARAQE